MHPDKDLAVDLIQGLPWSQLAKRIDYFPDDLGIQLRNFWETRIKYRDLEGVIRFKKKENRIPQEVTMNPYPYRLIASLQLCHQYIFENLTH